MPTDRTWHFVTSHAVIFMQVARTPNATVRELAEAAGLTERQTHRVLADLVAGDYVRRERVGRRNRYRVSGRKRMRHPSLSEHQVGDLLALLGGSR
jgi:DNA-binding MarR family transcriptional regulator